jgi:hypothetical protein
MGAAIVVGLAIIGLMVVLASSRRAPRLARPRARTVELTIDGDGVRRQLADGRTEAARWESLVEVELIRTPVTTADGANEFVVLSEDEEHGCLVPLRVGWDEPLLVELSRLPGFDVRAFDAEVVTPKRGRVVVWRRAGPPPQVEGNANAT